MKENYKTNYSINRVFDYDVYRGRGLSYGKLLDKDTDKQGTIATVRRTMQQNNILYTEYTYCEKGELFDQNLFDKKSGAIIGPKKGLDPEKYGGYKSIKSAYFSFIEFDGKKGARARQIIEVPIYIANRIAQGEDVLKEYFEIVKGLKNVRILREKIKKNSLISVDGFPMRIVDANKDNLGFKGNIQLIVGAKYEELIRKVEKFFRKKKKKLKQ